MFFYKNNYTSIDDGTTSSEHYLKSINPSMEKEKLTEQQQTQKLIKQYTTVYKVFFQYSFFIFPVIIWLVAAFLLQSKEFIRPLDVNAEFKQNTYTVKNWFYTPSRVSDQVWAIMNGFGDIKILWWELQATWNVLIGRNNIISLYGIILPDQHYIIDFSFTWGIDYFSGDYDVDRLTRVLNNWILSSLPTSSNQSASPAIDATFFRGSTSEQVATNMEQILAILKDRNYFMDFSTAQITAKEDDDIFAEYNLTCMMQTKMYDGFCNKNIEYFLQKLPNIDLEGSWDGVFLIANELKKEEHIDGFCTNLMYNVFKHPYPSSKLDVLMNWICSDYNLRYVKIKDFLKVENELGSISSDDVINNNLNANLFKLTSMWQKIIMQKNRKVFDASTIHAYLWFFDWFVHQGIMKVPQFYIDAGYYFNNAYLKNIVRQESATTTNSVVKNEVITIIDKINNLNRGNKSIWIKWLEEMVLNKKIIEKSNTTASLNVTIIQNFDDTFKNFLRGYPEFGIDKATTDSTTRTARVLWTLRYRGDDGSMKQESVIASFDYADNQFTLSSARLPNNSTIDTVLTNYLSHRSRTTLWDVLEFIKSNGSYEQVEINMCSILDDQSSWSLEECNDTSAIIEIKEQWWTTGTITFAIQNNSITSAETTNQQRKTYLDNHLNTYSRIGMDSAKSVLTRMISTSTQPDEGEDISSIEGAKIAINGKFKSFLGVEPNEIIEQNGKWIVSFSLKDLSFATIVDIPNNYKLSPLIVQTTNGVVTVQNFSLSLIWFEQIKINQFVNDPLGFIKQINPTAHDAIVNPVKRETQAQ